MSDNVWIVLIVAAAVVVVLYMFRDSLDVFKFKASKTGLNAELKRQKTKTKENGSVKQQAAGGLGSTSGVAVDENLLVGADQEIDVKKRSLLDRISISRNRMFGRGQKISVDVGENEESGREEEGANQATDE